MKQNKIAIIDNYDSFTYNLVHLIEKITRTKIQVFLNDKFEVEDLHPFEKIIISPGPGLPQNAGKTLELIETYKQNKSILGVCLGHQAIGVAFGATLKNLSNVYHGISSKIYISDTSRGLFKNINNPMIVGRYHSWVLNSKEFPSELTITAVDEEKNIMAIEHKHYNIKGVQFHPESIMTPNGEQLLRNWVAL